MKWTTVPEATLLRAVRDGRVSPARFVKNPAGEVMKVGQAFSPVQQQGRSVLAGIVAGALVGLAAVAAGALVAEGITYATSTREQRSIRASARRHEANGAVVAADHIGWGARPPIMGGRRADVVAVYSKHVVVEEHETIESVGRHHSVAQDADLRRWASRRREVRYRQVVT